MKVKISTIVLMLVSICIMYESRYLYLPLLSSLDSYRWNYIVASIYIILWLICRKNTIRTKIRKYCSFVTPFLRIVLFLVFIELIYTVKYSDLSFNTVLINSFMYLKLLLIYPLLYLMEEYGQDRFSRILIKIVGLMIVYCFIMAMIYNLTGVNLNTHLISNTDRIRNNRIRIQSIGLFWFILLLVFNSFLHAGTIRKRVLYGGFSLLIVLYLGFVNQSRSQMIAAFVMMIGMYIFNRKRSKSQIISLMVLGIIVVIYLSSPAFSSFLYTFSEDYEFNTTTVRMTMIQGYIEAIQRMPLKYLFGLGIRNSIEYLGKTRYFLDLGLLGDIFNTGCLAITLYFGVLFRLIVECKRFKKKDRKAFTLALGILMVMISGAPGFSILPNTRIIALPFMVAYVEYLNGFGRASV